MGWNTSALFVRARSVEDMSTFLAAAADYQPTGEVVAADVATSGLNRHHGDVLYLCDDGTQCHLWDPGMAVVPVIEELLDHRGVVYPVGGTTALAALFHSVTDIYGFWLYHDGELTRRALYEAGTVIDEVGDRQAFESRVDPPEWGMDEDFVWSVIREATGVDVGSYMNRDGFAVYKAVPATGTGPG